MREKPTAMSREEAEQIAVAGLSFVAADPDLLQRFLAITGIEAGDIRRAAQEPGFLAGVLQFILAHEPTMDSFCAESGLKPERVAAAPSALPFGGRDEWTGA